MSRIPSPANLLLTCALLLAAAAASLCTSSSGGTTIINSFCTLPAGVWVGNITIASGAGVTVSTDVTVSGSVMVGGGILTVTRATLACTGTMHVAGAGQLRLSEGVANAEEFTVGTGGVVSVRWNGTVDATTLNVGPGGVISGSGGGYEASEGPHGPVTGTGHIERGGAHAGCGSGAGDCVSADLGQAGTPFGSIVRPIMPGAGGVSSVWSSGSGGAGGAAVFLRGRGSLWLAGNVSSDGQPGHAGSSTAGGGGAGGSIVLETAAFTATSTAWISAAGGAGTKPVVAMDTSGGGSGGRVSLLWTSHAFPSTKWSDWGLRVSIAGGVGGGNGTGATGTLWIDCGSRNKTLVVEGGPIGRLVPPTVVMETQGLS